MRATPKRFIKTLFAGSLTCFVLINMNLFLQTGPSSRYGNGVFTEVDPPLGDHPPATPPVAATAAPVNRSANWSGLPGVAFHPFPPRPGAANSNNHNNNTPVTNSNILNSMRLVDPDLAKELAERIAKAGYVPVGNQTDIPRWKAFIRIANQRQHILNLEQFDLQASDNTVVIVVQVHNRLDYLGHLVDSLRKSKDIEQTLLIFSHDFFSDDINRLVHEIDFCPVMQIFYPFAIQLHPNEYPGEDPGDCPRNVNKQQAVKLNCANAAFPDKYGHYREAKYTQTKHHWFWKINHVFDFLDVTTNFNGPVLFIEEDHYMVEDFIPVLRSMYRLREQACKDCHIFTLATYDKRPMYHATSAKGLFQRIFGNQNQEPSPLVDQVDISPWVSSKHNMGMSLNRNVWQKIRPCAKEFCAFDDYNWDWSLQYIGMNCMPERLKVMWMKSPRIFHIGECGVHHKGKNCNPQLKVNQIEALVNANRDKLYPTQLSVAGYPRVPNKMPKPNGGWGDIRDHAFCATFTSDEGHR